MFLSELQLDGVFFLCEGVEGSLGPNGIPIQSCPESLLNYLGTYFFKLSTKRVGKDLPNV